MYDWEKKLKEGEGYEDFLDSYFKRWYSVTPVEMTLQRLGMDRIFEDATRRRFSVEYKSDSTAARTQRAFIETVSVDAQDKPGWALTSLAQILVYYIPPQRCAHIYRMLAIKKLLPELLQGFPIKRIPNNGYFTHGIAVPFSELKPCYIRTVIIDEQEEV